MVNIKLRTHTKMAVDGVNLREERGGGREGGREGGNEGGREGGGRERAREGVREGETEGGREGGRGREGTPLEVALIVLRRST